MTMDPNQAIYERLIADTEVAALIATRIYPQAAPQNAEKPYVTYRVVAAVDSENLEGSDGLTMRRYEFTSYAELYDDARSIVAAIKDSLQAFQGMMGSCEIDSIQFSDGDAGSDSYDDDEKTHQTTIDFRVFYHPS